MKDFSDNDGKPIGLYAIMTINTLEKGVSV
jgi:hypothetical protein